MYYKCKPNEFLNWEEIEEVLDERKEIHHWEYRASVAIVSSCLINELRNFQKYMDLYPSLKDEVQESTSIKILDFYGRVIHIPFTTYILRAKKHEDLIAELKSGKFQLIPILSEEF